MCNTRYKMDYSGKKINNRLVQICVLTECQKYAWTKLPDVCQYGDRKKNQPKNKAKHIYFRHYRIRIDHKV
jgi:hypothetical protein